MIMRKSEWIIGLVLLLAAAALPLAGHWARRDAGRSCAYDGVAIDPIYRVRVVDHRGGDHEFCCIRCAEFWQEGQKAAPRAIYVTGEADGKEVDAEAAYFVRSSVVTTPTTGNRIHAFRNRAEAERHAGAVGGTILSGPERPFAGRS